MAPQLVTLGVLIAVFVIATLRPIHMGALALAAALAVGTTVVGESVAQILEAFPVDILLLLLGVTLLFGIARSNGSLEWLVVRAVRATGNRLAALPGVFFLLSAGIASLGSPLAAITLYPFAVSFAGRYRLSPALLLLAATMGATTGSFAPTSLFGLLTVQLAQRNGIDLNPLFLFGAAAGINLILLAAAWRIFRTTLVDEAVAAATSRSEDPGAPEPSGSTGTRSGDRDAAAAPSGLATQSRSAARLSHSQWATMGCVAALVISVVAFAVVGVAVDVGALSLGLAMLLSLAYSREAAPALREVDWSTILLVGGVVTYVGILNRLGVIDTVARLGVQIPSALLAAFILCLCAAAISSVGSTTGLLPIILPLAIPLATSGSVPAMGVMCALALSSSLVDVSPLSTAGAAAVSAAPEALRPRLRSLFLRWGLSMIVVGPLLTCGLLVSPGI